MVVVWAGVQVVWHGDMHGSYLWDMGIMGGAEGGTLEPPTL
jgi:hypothetical protein